MEIRPFENLGFRKFSIRLRDTAHDSTIDSTKPHSTHLVASEREAYKLTLKVNKRAT